MNIAHEIAKNIKADCIDDLIDLMVARILDHLGVEQGLVPRWGYDQR